MEFGGPFGADFGDVEDQVNFDVEESGDSMGLIVHGLVAAEGAGDENYVCTCDGAVRMIIRIPEGQTLPPFFVPCDPRLANHAIRFSSIGDWPDDRDLDMAEEFFEFLVDKGRALQIDFDAHIELLTTFGDAGQLSGWALPGIQRWKNCRPLNGSHNQGRIDIEISTSGSVHTVTLSLDGIAVAIGVRTGDGVVQFVEQNNSGLQDAEATLAYSADLTLDDGAFIAARWAKRYELHIVRSSLWPLSFPRTPEAVLQDPGIGNRFSFKKSLLPSVQVSD